MTRVVTVASMPSTSAAVGREGCAPKRDAARAPAAHDRRSAVSGSRPSSQRDEQAGGEGVAGRRAVDRVHLRRLRPRDLLAVLQQHRPLRSERQGHDPVAPPQHLELVAVDDGEVGVDVDRPCGGGVEAEETARLLPGRVHGRVRDLELA